VDRAKGKTLDEISAIVRGPDGGRSWLMEEIQLTSWGWQFFFPLFTRFFHIPGGAGFLPSTICLFYLFYMRVEHDGFLNGM